MSFSDKPKLLADANIPYKVVKLLLERGFDVITPPSFAKDDEVAKLAKSKERIIITFDRHFGNILLFPPEKYAGIIFIRINPPIINSVFSALIKLFDNVKPDDFKGKLYVLSLPGFRVFPKSNK